MLIRFVRADMLGLPPGASEHDIREAYRTMALDLDPHNNKSAAVRARFLEITHAFKHLSEGHTCDSDCESGLDTEDEDSAGAGAAANMYDVFAQMFPEGAPPGYSEASGGGYRDYAEEDEGECGCPRCKERYRATPRPGFRAKPLRNRHQHNSWKYGSSGGDRHRKAGSYGGKDKQSGGGGTPGSAVDGGSKDKSGSKDSGKTSKKQPKKEQKKRNPYAMDPPVVTQLQSHAITVQWVNPNNRQDCGSKITKYTLMLRQAENTPAWAVAYVGKERSYKIPCVTAGRSYQLKVRAENSLGPGNFSPIVTCTTPGQRVKGAKHPEILSNVELAASKRKQDELRRKEAEAAKRRKAELKKQQQEEQRRKEREARESKERADKEKRMAELIEYERMKRQMAKVQWN